MTDALRVFYTSQWPEVNNVEREVVHLFIHDSFMQSSYVYEYIGTVCTRQARASIHDIVKPITTTLLKRRI
jgi:hypothetical protein